jgi:protein arginine N-methyltransferase 1
VRDELPGLTSDWDDVYGFDYSCIKEIALKEPLVDCVELRAVATQPAAIKHIDIKTVKKEDLAFKVPFELKATRNDCEFSPANTVSRVDT